MERSSILTLTLTRIKGTSHEDHYTFMVISFSVLRIRNFSVKFSRVKQTTHFMFSNFFPTIVLNMG